jgi:transposase
MCKQRKRERQTAFGTVNPNTGQTIISFADKGNYQSFKKHLKKILSTYSKVKNIIVVVDNVRYHHARLLKKWLEKHPQLEILYLPPYSPELNPIERVWWFMRKSITHNRYIHSLKERKIFFWRMFSHFQKPNFQIINICANIY